MKGSGLRGDKKTIEKTLCLKGLIYRINYNNEGYACEQCCGYGLEYPIKKLITQDGLNPVIHVYIEESFDTIFNMCYGSGKSRMDERVKG